MTLQSSRNRATDSGIAMAEGKESTDISELIPLKIFGRKRVRVPFRSFFTRRKSRSSALTAILMSRMQNKTPAVFQLILLLIEDKGELVLQKTKIYKTLQARGWKQSAHAECTTYENISESDRHDWAVALSIDSQSFQLNYETEMPPDLRSKKGHQNFFEVSENCGTDCITRPLQLRFDLLSCTGENMSVLYNEDPLSYSERFFARMGVVNPQSLSQLLEIERSAAERVLCDLWGDYSKQQEQIIGRWMKMSGNNDSLALHELLQQLRPVDFVSRRGQKHVKRLQELEKSQTDNETIINELKLILVDCLVEISECQDDINTYVSLRDSCTRMLRERGVLDQTLERSLEDLITQPSQATPHCIPFSRVAQTVNEVFTHREIESELELNRMQGLNEDDIQAFKKKLAEARKSEDAIKMFTELVEIISNLCLKNRETLQISEDVIRKYRRRVNLDVLLMILEAFFDGSYGTKLRARIDQLADLHDIILKSKINYHFFKEDATLVILELLSFAKASFSRFVQFELQGIDKAYLKTTAVGYEKASSTYFQSFEIKLGKGLGHSEFTPAVQVFEEHIIEEYGVLGGELVLPANCLSSLRRVRSQIEVIEQQETNKIIVRSRNFKVLHTIHANICCEGQTDIRLYRLSLVLRPKPCSDSTADLTLMYRTDPEAETKLELHHDEHFQVKYTELLVDNDEKGYLTNTSFDLPAMKTWASLSRIHCGTIPQQIRRAPLTQQLLSSHSYKERMSYSTERLAEASHTRVRRAYSSGADSCASCGSTQSLNVYLKTNIFANGEHVVNSIGDGCNVNLV